MLRIAAWQTYQHYRDRNPPWIKLHVKLLDSYDFGRLQDASKAHAVGLMLLAARTENHFPEDPGWIASKINATAPVNLACLIACRFLEPCSCDVCASASLASRKQTACTETETETETETDAGTSSLVAPRRVTHPDMLWKIEVCWDAHTRARQNFFREMNGSAPAAPKLTPKIRRAIETAIKLHDESLASREDFTAHSRARAAGIGLFLDPWMTGEDPQNDINNGGKRYLEAERPWTQQRGKTDPVIRFSDLYFEKRALEGGVS